MSRWFSGIPFLEGGEEVNRLCCASPCWSRMSPIGRFYTPHRGAVSHLLNPSARKIRSATRYCCESVAALGSSGYAGSLYFAHMNDLIWNAPLALDTGLLR